MPPTYLIFETNENDTYGNDYVDYLLEVEYKSSPSKLLNIPVSEKELGDCAYYDGLCGYVKENGNSSSHQVPIGKLVV